VFFLPELPPLRGNRRPARMALPVMGSHADLDPGGRPGLAAHAQAEFGVPVIGVADRSRDFRVRAVNSLMSPPLYGSTQPVPLQVLHGHFLPEP
jgi:hypothetical protein